MRTTLTIDDDVAEAMDRLRARENWSLRVVTNRLLRLGLQYMENRPAARPFRAKTYDMGLQPGIDPNRLNQLADELEVESFKKRHDLS